MRIRTFALPGRVSNNQLLGHTVIVIDVLRATSCIVWALHNGANRVIPTADAGTAAAIASRLGEVLLAGERGGIRQPGFLLGNSPLEFTPAAVKGKNIVMNTTNGTSAICSAEGAKEILIGSMINRTAVAKRAIELGHDIILLCAGTEGEVSADDICAAGSIATALEQLATEDISCCDMTKIARVLYTDWKEGRADLAKTYHYSRLVNLGFSEDVAFCLQEDRCTIVPAFENGAIS